ncbi:hypothetical protein EJB05_13147, partial [Eragrostis curvula]
MERRSRRGKCRKQRLERDNEESITCAKLTKYSRDKIVPTKDSQNEMDTDVNKDLGLPTGETIFGKTVLILGFGAIGVEIAKRLRPFGVKILATKRSWSEGTSPCDINGLVDKKSCPEDMYGFAGEADILITSLMQPNETVEFLLVPLFLYLATAIRRLFFFFQSRIVNHKFVAAMKKARPFFYHAVLHVAWALTFGWMEPFDPEDPILKFPNVIITPHVAGVTEYSHRTRAMKYYSIINVVGDVALQLHSGEPFTGIEFVN